jgi:hypothetical protein
VPHARHGVQVEQVPAALGKSSHVFIWVDKHWKPLQQPYKGPFKVVKHRSKTVKVQRGTKVEDITVDRLKPAFVNQSLLNHLVEVNLQGRRRLCQGRTCRTRTGRSLVRNPRRQWEQTVRAQEDGETDQEVLPSA